MRLALLVAVLAALAVLALASGDARLRADFAAFKLKHRRHYADAAEDERRFGYFRAHMARAAELARVNPHATFGATIFADRAPDERPSGRKGAVVAPPAKRAALPEAAAARAAAGGKVPTFVNWTARGAVTAVPNQGQCGDPCSFSVAGVIESMHFLAGNKLVALSEQQLTSCVAANDGCNGCWPANDYDWIINQNDGWLATNASYPYASGSGEVPACKTHGLVNGAQIKASVTLPSNESAMRDHVAFVGPLSIAINADPLEYYTGGVLTNCPSSQEDVNHVLLLTGFSFENASLPFWMFRNQWGTEWGDPSAPGYAFVLYGVDACDLTDMPTTVVVGAPPPPTPSPAPTPAPTPAPPTPTHVLKQTYFYDLQCAQEKDYLYYPVGVCQELGGEVVGSYRVDPCTAASQTVTLRTFDNDYCGGAGNSTVMALNTCLVGEHMDAYTNACVWSDKAAAPVAAAGARRPVA